MKREQALQELIDRLVSGAGPGAQVETDDLSNDEAGSVAMLERMFTAFAAVREELRDDSTPPAGHAAGERVGNFHLRECIGVGGMGEVWLAERGDGAVEQRVAVKFVRGAQVRWIDRLEHERRLLARLAHPYIARFLDAGQDARGMPYLVMDYVEGEPIDRWCDTRALDLAGRIDLVLKVCEAVEHAHRQLVVHRDLKPANILVCADGTPRLLDFGIAMLVETPGAAHLPSESPVLTLAWAAPEQLAGAPVSTATDVHALGLVLLKLVAGSLPKARREGSLIELVEGRDAEPPCASRLLEAAAPAGWPLRPRDLRGDGDAIVARALRSEPRERYGSVSEFAADLRRWRDAHPVHARASTRLYRMRRFVRRHRLGVALSVLAVLALAGGLGVALWQAGVARAEAARADAEAHRAGRVADFVTGLLREQDPMSRKRAHARSARELVAEGASRARDELADVPALRASMLGMLGEAMTGLGDAEQGRRLLEEARTGFDEASSEAARIDGVLGAIAIDQGRQAEGTVLLDSALARLRAGNADDLRAAARISVRRAFVLHDEGKPEAGLSMLRDIHAALAAALGSDDLDVLDVESGLLAMLSQMRRDDEAEPLARSLVERIERIAGAESARLLDPLNYRAQIAKRRDRYDESLALFDRAIVLARLHKGERNDLLAGLHSRKANLQQDAGRLVEALASLDAAEAALPADAAIERAQMLATRGDTLIDLGRFAEAEVALREALRIRRAAGGDKDALVWYSQSEWGRALVGLGRGREALAAQREALARIEAIMGPQAYQLTFVLRALSTTHESLGEPARSVEVLRRAVQLAAARYPPTHGIVVQYRTSLAAALRRSGDDAAALAEAQAIIDLREGHPELGVHLARAALIKARVLESRGERDAVRALARQGLADLDAGAADNADTRRDLVELAGLRR